MGDIVRAWPAGCSSLLGLYSDFEAGYEIRRGAEDDWREIELVFSPDDGAEEDESDPENDFATVLRGPAPAAEIAELTRELEGVEPASGARRRPANEPRRRRREVG